jgi:2-oxoisovalerate dehydrogenase E1 component alpha subunit
MAMRMLEPPSVATSGDLLALYAQMRRVRALNDEAIALQRQGALTGFAPCTGQEAAQVGSAVALDPGADFAFPTYREFGAMLALGVEPLAVLAHHRGLSFGGVTDSAAQHVAPIASVVGGTALHAVGWAMGAKLAGDAACALAYFGDGASSQGEVHEAMNFAAVFELPVVFFCQNNGWAISVPAGRQVAGGSVAARAAGYGLPGARVDGNDVAAVRDATAQAVRRAREGGGATVIEAMTYRQGPHSTSDDPSRYRDADEERAWLGQDPIARARDELAAVLDDPDARFAEIERAIELEVEAVRAGIADMPVPTMREQMALTYAAPPPATQAAHAAWLRDGVDV